MSTWLIHYFFGFNPDTPNNDEIGSFPQHGVVEAAGAIIRSQDNDYNKKRELGKLVNVLGSLRKSGANMEDINRQSVTALGKYNERISDKPSISDGIYQLVTGNDDLGKRINDLLSPETPYVHPPHPSDAVQPPQGAPPQCDLLKLPYSYNYNTERSSVVGFESKYYFTYKDNLYYFSSDMNKLIDDAFKGTTQAGQPGDIKTFNVRNEDKYNKSSTTFNFSYKRPHPPGIGGSIPYLGPEHVSFNIEGVVRCRIDADVGMLPQSN